MSATYGPNPVDVLLSGLVDDAGLFPPASLSMASALAAHLEITRGAHADLCHRFLCPSTRLGELQDELGGKAMVLVGVIASGTNLAGELAMLTDPGRPHLPLGTVELAAVGSDPAVAAKEAVTVLEEVPRSVRCFVELPRSLGWRDGLDVVAAAGHGAKIRCGGTTKDAFPTEVELADAVQAVVDAGLSFKATAGLHNAMRHTDTTTGFEHHGFLNLLLAVAQARSGGDPLAALAERNPRVVVTEVKHLTIEQAEGVRATLFGFGSCSVREAITDLRDLELLR